MAKISTYPFPSPPSASDYVIGTDTNDALATKNFMISDILALGGTTYVPYTGAIQDVDLGSFSLYTYSLYMQGGPIYDGNGSPGSSGEILSSQGPGNSPIWVDLSTLATAYVPYTGASQDVDLGSFSLFTYGIVLQGGTIVDGNDSEGTLGQVLTSQGPGNMPLWADLSSSVYVPYTGATSNVDLGSNSLTTSSGIILSGSSSTLNVSGSNGSNYDVLISQGSNTPQWQSLSSVVSSGSLINGSFYNSLNQNFSANISTRIIIDSVSFANGVSVISDGTNLTRITFVSSAKYSLSITPFIYNSSGNSHDVDIWLTKNGDTSAFNIPNTRRTITTGPNNHSSTLTLNYFIDVNSGDYIYIMFRTPTASVYLGYNSAGSLPASPSITVNINQV